MIQHRMLATMGVLVATCVSSCWIAWSQRSSAQSTRDAAAQIASLTDQNLRELVQLQSRAAVVDQRERPGEAMVSPLRAALEQEGMGSQCLTGVSLQDPQPIAEGQLARQEASVTLTGVRTAELARALVRWSQGQPLWTIRTIRLDRSESSRASSGETLDRFTAVITIDNIHINARRTGQTPVLGSARSGQ